MNETKELDKTLVEKVGRYRWAVFGILALIYFFVYFHRVSPAVMAGDFTKEFGISAGALGVLGAAYFYPYAIAQLPSGILADTWGTRKTVTTFVLIASVGAFLTGVATNFNMVIVGRVLIGLGVGFVYVPIMRILANWFRVHEFASLTGVLLAIGNIGALSAAAPLAYLSVMMSWKSVFYILGGITIILCGLAYLIVRDKPTDKGWPSVREIEESEGKIFKEPPARIRVGKALKTIFGSARFWPLAVWCFILYGSMMTYQGLWGGPYFKDVVGWTKITYGSLLSLVAVGMIVGCPLWGYISDKIKSRKKVIMIGSICFTGVWFGLWLSIGSTNYAVYAILNFLFGFFGGNFIVSYAQVSELYPREVAGTTTGALNIFFFLGGAVMQQTVSAIIGAYGKVAGAYPVTAYRSAWLFMAVAMVVATICAFLSKEKKIIEEKR